MMNSEPQSAFIVGGSRPKLVRIGGWQMVDGIWHLAGDLSWRGSVGAGPAGGMLMQRANNEIMQNTSHFGADYQMASTTSTNKKKETKQTKPKFPATSAVSSNTSNFNMNFKFSYFILISSSSAHLWVFMHLFMALGLNNILK